MTHHIEPDLIVLYRRGSLPAREFVPVDRHLGQCADCREVLARAAGSETAEAGWQRLSAVLDEPSRSPLERLLVRIGVPEHLARLLLATPVLRRSWLLASLVTLLFTVIGARLSPGVSATLLLVAAPLIPAAGVAVSYGPAFDPMHELGLVLPAHRLRLILFRSTTVLIVSTTLSALVALAVPARGAEVFGWLAPSLAVTALTLTLSAFVDPPLAAELTGAGWLVAWMLAGQGGVTHSLLLTLPGQAAVTGLLLMCTVFIAAQRQRFETGERWSTTAVQ